jgi:hypothetical protein
MKAIRVMLWVLFCMYPASFCHGQAAELMGGSGLTIQSGDTHRSLYLGAGFSAVTPMVLRRGAYNIPYGYLIELGYAGPLKNFRSGSTFFSADYEGAFSFTEGLMPFITVGYTRILGTGNALNYGGGVDYIFPNWGRGIRAEVREYRRISGAREKDLVFRFGFIFCIMTN